MAAQEDDQQMLWKQYQLLCDLHTFYLRLIIEASAFFYAITGGILALALTNAKTAPNIRLLLFIPLVLSVAFAFLCFRGRKYASETRNKIIEIGDELKVKIKVHADILITALLIAALMYGLFAAVIVVLLFTAFSG